MKLLISAVLIGFCWAANACADEQQTSKMDLLLQEFEKKDAPGMVIAVMQDGKTVYSKTIGMSNLEYSIENSDTTVFDMASLAKQFTGYAVARLVKEGKLELDDLVNEYLPELGEPHQEITLRHLAHHTSGIRDIGELFGLGGFSAPLTSKEAFELIRRQSKLNFPLGSEYEYSNSNYVLLALVVEKVTGMSFREWCAQNVFEELAMTNSFVNDDPKKVIQNRAVAYYKAASEFSFDQNNGMSLIGSSAVYSSLEDMQKWLTFLMTSSEKDGPAKLMLTPGSTDNGESVAYGMGLSVHPFRGITMVEHSGATPSGFRSQMAFFPEKGLGFVVLSNWGDVDVIEQIAKPLIDIYLGETPELKVAAKERPQAAALSNEHLQRFVGDFILDEEDLLTISLSEDKFTLELEGRGKVQGIAVSTDTIYIQELNSKLKFVKNAWDEAKVIEGDKETSYIKRKVENEVQDEIVYRTKPDLAGFYFNDEMDLLFSVEVTTDGKVLLHKSAASTVELVHRSGEQFRDEGWDLSRVEFSRDESGRPLRISIDSGSRCRNVEFQRINLLAK